MGGYHLAYDSRLKFIISGHPRLELEQLVHFTSTAKSKETKCIFVFC